MKITAIFTKVRGTLAVHLPRVANAIAWGTGGAALGTIAPYIDNFIPDSAALSFTLATIGGVIGLCEGYTRTAERQRFKREEQTEKTRRRQTMRFSEPLYET